MTEKYVVFLPEKFQFTEELQKKSVPKNFWDFKTSQLFAQTIPEQKVVYSSDRKSSELSIFEVLSMIRGTPWPWDDNVWKFSQVKKNNT